MTTSTSIRTPVTERIRYIIENYCNGSNKEFSARTKIQYVSVSKLKNGKTDIKEYVERIAKAFPNISYLWILTGIGTPENQQLPDFLRLQMENMQLRERLALREREITILQDALSVYQDLRIKRKPLL